jgi:hypothetical protein
MGQVVQVNGDYDIVTAEGSTIRLNTGPNVGQVRVTGNLIVDGDTLTISAENLTIQDNVIVLNFGETGAGVTLEYSGIQVDRGSLAASTLLLDDRDTNNPVWQIAEGIPTGTFSFANSSLRVRNILTDSDTDSGDLTLIGFGTGVVKVIGTNNYEQQVTHDDDVPNKKYVDDAIQSNPTFQIRSPGLGTAGDTRVVAFDRDASYLSSSFPIGFDDIYTVADPTGLYPNVSHIAFLVDDKRVAIITEKQFEMRGLTIFPEDTLGPDIVGAGAGIQSDAVTIQATNTNSNIRLETNGTGKVQITYAIQLDNNGVTPGAVTGSTVFYAGPVAAGTSGLYAVNTDYTQGDELVLKNRALLFSMIF